MKSKIDFLIIDDEITFSETLQKSLAKRSYTALYAQSLDQALELFCSNQFDRIILDQKLAYESGLELLQHKDQIKNSKIVVLTGYASISSTTFALKNGAFNLLQKPASLDEILNAFNDTPSTSPAPLEIPSLDIVEKEHIQRVLNEHGGNISRTAKALGMHRRSLQRKMLSNNLEPFKS